jgi:hypothetical protein
MKAFMYAVKQRKEKPYFLPVAVEGLANWWNDSISTSF